MSEQLERAIAFVEESGCRVLRKLDLYDDKRLTGGGQGGNRYGLCLDTETTGEKIASDKMVELGMVLFEYEPQEGKIVRICETYSGLEDPGFPMTEEIIAIHGITNEEVAGKVFDEAAVRRLAEQADIVIAHSAHFDRPFVEKRFPLFNDKRWACSCDQVNWKAEGVSSKVLQYLLVFLAGRYFDGAHRALNDTEALVAVLMENLPVSGKTALKILLDEVDKGTVLFYAVDAPFAKKDTLKGRGYRWNDGSNGKPKCWWIEVPNSVEKEEEDFLAKEIYLPGRSKSLKKVALDATIRFSQRDAYAAVVGGANSSETQAALPLA